MRPWLTVCGRPPLAAARRAGPSHRVQGNMEIRRRRRLLLPSGTTYLLCIRTRSRCALRPRGACHPALPLGGLSRPHLVSGRREGPPGSPGDACPRAARPAWELRLRPRSQPLQCLPHDSCSVSPGRPRRGLYRRLHLGIRPRGALGGCRPAQRSPRLPGAPLGSVVLWGRPSLPRAGGRDPSLPGCWLRGVIPFPFPNTHPLPAISEHRQGLPSQRTQVLLSNSVYSLSDPLGPQ